MSARTTSPPAAKKEPRLATGAKVNQQRSNSCARSYHKRTKVPRASSALAAVPAAHLLNISVKERHR
jgi:hypothetical protein